MLIFKLQNLTQIRSTRRKNISKALLKSNWQWETNMRSLLAFFIHCFKDLKEHKKTDDDDIGGRRRWFKSMKELFMRKRALLWMPQFFKLYFNLLVEFESNPFGQRKKKEQRRQDRDEMKSVFERLNCIEKNFKNSNRVVEPAKQSEMK